MLNIAVLGSLAKHLGSLDLTELKTDATYSFLPTKDAHSTKFDLVLYLEDDNSVEPQLSTLRAVNPMITSIESVWKDVPSPQDLDRAIHNSLFNVYGLVVGYSASMHTVCRWIRAVAHQATAALDLRTLVIGETGTGKELVAQAIHKLSIRHESPFIALNCSGLPPEIIDTELFGHKRGAFTGAISDRKGALQSAGGGILFLDEIGDLPLNLQVKFLRVLEQRSFTPIGSDTEYPLLAQVISATNLRLDEAVKKGTFRADLYFRIAQLTISLPSLKERRDDIPLLISFFLNQHGLETDFIDQVLLQKMVNYDWPGNIRELRTAVDRLVLLWRNGEPVDAQSWQLLPSVITTDSHVGSASLAELREDFDRRVLEEVLARCDGDTACAAEELGISRRSIYNLARRHGIDLSRTQRN